MKRATNETAAGRCYLQLQQEARRIQRPTDELFQLYALECFIDRLIHSRFAKHFILKGGALLAALDARRPTRDVDLAARALDNGVNEMLGIAKEIAAMVLDDGIVFNADSAAAEAIRENDHYSGVRITLEGTLSRARINLHVDINVGDPIWPEPKDVQLPRLLGGALTIRGYPLEMVLAEKIVTTIARGKANTRWRDFADIYTLTKRHEIDVKTLQQSMIRVADYRGQKLESLRAGLDGYAEASQARWLGWIKRQRLESTVPADFSLVLDEVIAFADPVIESAMAHTSDK